MATKIGSKSSSIFRELFSIITIADKILILFLICLSIFIHFYFIQKAHTTEAEIIYKGKVFGKYDLRQEKTIQIDKGIVVEIRNGKARLAKDTSPRQIGVNQGWSSQIPIISVPSELMIRFSGSQDEMLITY
jgi:hypothetical protein